MGGHQSFRDCPHCGWDEVEVWSLTGYLETGRTDGLELYNGECPACGWTFWSEVMEELPTAEAIAEAKANPPPRSDEDDDDEDTEGGAK
jgi:hypothetical protein